MHIVTVDNFLCCFDLETGGYFLGWLGTVFVSLALVVAIGAGVFTVLIAGDIGDIIKQQNGTDTQFNNWILKAVLESQLRKSFEIMCAIFILLYFNSANFIVHCRGHLSCHISECEHITDNWNKKCNYSSVFF